ncbi:MULTISPECIES: PAS domain S-box protein [unclassified Anabaena]|uniref:hybrid sensor histidine kinase/response regulator n=1 Tax=unclassified Anabaena TaxID=2619674 RepID=UPI00082D8275|nr:MULTISPECIES: PAS domain S-box protein [unclassified Anabaena]
MKRDHKGRFIQAWDSEPKQAFRLSLTKTAWQILEQQASEHGISCSEVIERYARSLQPNSVSVDIGKSDSNVDASHHEQALQESEERARLAIQVARLGTWRYNPSTEIVEIDGRMREIWGEPDDTVMIPLSRVMARIHPDDRASVTQAMNAALNPQSSGSYELDYRILWSDGTERWLSANGKAQFTGEGASRRAVGFFGTAFDITDSKQAEKALDQSNARLRQLVKLNLIGVMFWDLDGSVLDANDAFLNMVGYTREDLQAGRLNWRSLTPVEQITWSNDSLQKMQQSTCDVLEKEYIRKDGTRIPVLLGGAMFVDSQSQGVSFVIDLTKRKQTEAALRESEERFRTLADNIPQLAWMADENGWIFWYSRRWFDYTGTTLAAMEGWGWQKVHHPEHVERVVEKIRHCFATGETWEDTFPLRSHDGQYRWFLSRAIPVRDEQGKVLRWFGTNTDITAQKAAETERELLLEREQAAREAAETANRMKDEFLAVLSHELRTPLNPILGWAKLLQTTRLHPEKFQQGLATIERNAQQQVQLIDDLLDISRIMRGKLSMNFALVALETPIKAAIETVQLALEAKSIQLMVSLAPNVGQVMGDAGRLQQVVWNLLSNAIKFTPEGGQVTVQLTPVGCHAHIQVSDTGKGIQPEFLPHVFELFKQQDSSTTRRFGGLGLGLAIVRQVVEAHGGTVTVDSLGEGKGATFTVGLPLVAAATPVSSSLGENPGFDLENVRVLVVDDEIDNLELITFLLEEEGGLVTAVSSATAALEALSQSHFDVLVSDIGMPQMNGYSLIKKIRSLSSPFKREMPAIALTAYASDKDKHQALAAGFQFHLAKPINSHLLLSLITKLAQRKITHN